MIRKIFEEIGSNKSTQTKSASKIFKVEIILKSTKFEIIIHEPPPRLEFLSERTNEYGKLWSMRASRTLLLSHVSVMQIIS